MRLTLLFVSFTLLTFSFACKNQSNSQQAQEESAMEIVDSLPLTTDITETDEQTSDASPEPEPEPEPEPKPNEVHITTNTVSPANPSSISSGDEAKKEPIAPPKALLTGNVEQDAAASAPVEAIDKEAEADVTEEKEAEPIPVKEEKIILKANHDAWDKLLRQYVSASGKVNYAGFKSNKSALDAYLKHLADNPVANDWSRNEKMAYWINAYNAFTVKLIVDNYPLSSITKLHGGKPWDVKWIKLGDKTYSLNNIENDILRPRYKDVRIHFAVNCAAKSCPPLLNKAWTATNLNSNFERQARQFINNASFNKIEKNKVQISKIFEWYAGDFGNIIDYLNKYSNTKINSSAKVEYLEYNWELNN